MNITVRTTLMQDRITELLNGGVFDGIVFTFVEKKGMALTFRASGDNIETVDVEAIVKKAIKSTDYGKGIYFSVSQE